MKLKQKDVIYVILAAVMFSITGIIAYSQLAPKKTSTSKGATVEVVDPISADLNQSVLSTLGDPAKARDYTVTADLTTGIGNKAPFGPF